MKIFLFKILLLEKELERALQEWVQGEIEKLSNRTDCPFIKDEIYNLIQEIKLQASYLNDKVIFGMIETWIGLVPRHVFQLMRTEDNFVFNYAEMAQIMIQAKSLTASEKFSAEIKVGNRKFYLVEEDKELINEVENKIEQEVIIIPDKDSTKEKLEERKSASFDRVSMHSL
jgi:hypothetical protein